MNGIGRVESGAEIEGTENIKRVKLTVDMSFILGILRVLSGLFRFYISWTILD